jgi:glycosyltransferase involved in cell wall biosynthesis
LEGERSTGAEHTERRFWGHAFVEAMAHGLACVGTTRCAMPEIIDDGVTGRLVAAGARAPLADALIELLSDAAE